MAGSSGLPPYLSELRMVLIRPDKYKSDTVANTILGRQAFQPGKMMENQVEEVNGRKVCLVKAPLWLRGYYLCDTPNLVKDELVLSSAECPPGPHAFIIQIEANLPFTNLCRRSVQQHMELLGENVWNHTLVLFTNVDWQDNYTVEQHIEIEGEALQWLLGKCANRYHVFDSVQNNDQVEQLFRKVEEMVSGNDGRHYETDDALLSGTKQRREEVVKKAKEKRLRVQEERKQPQRQEATLTELRVVMLGWVVSGKSLTGNIILNTDVVGKEGHTTKRVKYCGQVEDRQITIVDTPGWWKFLGAEFTSDSVKAEILKGVSMCSPYPHAFLLMIPADTSFTEEQKKVVEDNMKLLGEQVWSHTIVVFTYSKWLCDYTIEDHIESEGEALQWLIEKCGNRYHIFDKEVKDINNVSALVRSVEEMVSGNSPYETLSPVENRVSSVVQKEDAPLLKMVEVLYREWDWRTSEWFEISQLYHRKSVVPISQSSLREPLWFSSETTPGVSVQHKGKLHRSVKQTEIIETLLGNSFLEGRNSLSELMEKTLKNFEKDNQESSCINSLESGKTVLNPQWKELIEKEWSRRDDTLMYNIISKLSKQVTNHDDTSSLDPQEKDRCHRKVLSWLNRGHDSGTGSVETPESSNEQQWQ